MSKGYIIFLIFSVAVYTSTAIDFSIKGDPCSKLDSCYSKENTRTCSCSSECYLYGTCCQDAEKFGLTKPKFVCNDRKTIAPVFVKQSCADDFKGHIMIVKACFENDIDEKDVQHNLFVTSYKTGITYFNNHCAICNNDADDFEFWNIKVFCPQRDNVNKELIWKNLTFYEEKRQWGLHIGDEFILCTVRYTPPSYIHQPDYCIPNLLSNCPEDYSDKDVIAKCIGYYAERKHKHSNLYFRNAHCAICNGVELRELECSSGMNYEDAIEETGFQNMVEEVFTKGRWLNRNEGPREICSKNYLFDPVRARCRKYVYKITKNSSVCLRLSLISLSIFLILLF